MSSYQPPLKNPAIFDSEYFKNEFDSFNQTEMNNRYVKYPVAQSTVTLKGGIVNGTTRITGDTITKNRIEQNLNTSNNFTEVNGVYALDKNKMPLPNPLSSGVLSTSSWDSRVVASNDDFHCVCWSPQLELFCAIADNGAGNRIMTSPNGITWTTRVPAVAGYDWKSITWSPNISTGIFCAVGIGSSAMTSTDGINWVLRTCINGRWESIVWSPEINLFVAVGWIYGSFLYSVMTSPNGVTWSSQTGINNNTWSSVCWSPELGIFVAITGTNYNGQQVMYSSNGINWIGANSASSASWESVCWSSQLGLFCAVASTSATTNQMVMTSEDGINWNIQTTPVISDTKSITWANDIGLFCTTGVSNKIMTSPDGINWTDYTIGNTFFWSICWSPELGIFCMVGNSKVYTSNLAGQNPTSNNVFNSTFNNIDVSGNWTLKAKQLIRNDGNLTIGSTFGNTTIQSETNSSIILNNHSIVNNNIQFPSTFISPSAGQLGYNFASSTFNSTMTSGVQINNVAFTINSGVWMIIMYSKFRKSASGSPSSLNLFNTTMAISTTTSITGSFYEKIQMGLDSTANGYIFPSGTTQTQAGSYARIMVITGSTPIYILNSASFTANAGDVLSLSTFANCVRIA